MFNITRIVLYLNAYRALYCAPPLTWNNNCYNFAQSWTNQMALNNKFGHSNSFIYGENIALISYVKNTTDQTKYLLQAIDLWMHEGISYNFNATTFSPTAGHFTALIWRSATSFGIASSLSAKGNLMIALEIYPPTNINTPFAYARNVQKCPQRTTVPPTYNGVLQRTTVPPKTLAQSSPK
jgi:hypothetical protein